MNEDKIMSAEAFNELIDGFEIVGSLTEYGRRNVKYHVKKLQEENQQLKEQLNKKYENVGTLTSEILYEENTRLINQQKEFIEWLEQKVKKYTPNLRVSELDEFGYRVAQYINAEVYEIPPEDVVKEVLSKYKEIIGVEM